ATNCSLVILDNPQQPRTGRAQIIDGDRRFRKNHIMLAARNLAMAATSSRSWLAMAESASYCSLVSCPRIASRALGTNASFGDAAVKQSEVPTDRLGTGVSSKMMISTVLPNISFNSGR